MPGLERAVEGREMGIVGVCGLLGEELVVVGRGSGVGGWWAFDGSVHVAGDSVGSGDVLG